MEGEINNLWKKILIPAVNMLYATGDVRNTVFYKIPGRFIESQNFQIIAVCTSRVQVEFISV